MCSELGLVPPPQGIHVYGKLATFRFTRPTKGYWLTNRRGASLRLRAMRRAGGGRCQGEKLVHGENLKRRSDSEVGERGGGQGKAV